MNRLILPALILMIVGPFFAFDLHHYLSLDGLRHSLGEFQQMRDASPAAIMLEFLLAYVVVTAFSLPGAAVMTIAAGALFGLAWETVIASFASSIGALLAFLASRYLLRDAVQAEAVRTTAVARRVIQEWNAIGRGTSEQIGRGSDDVLVSISQLIEQDVNIFDGPTLFATSERDLFSSGFLPTRTHSRHYIADAGFRAALRASLQREEALLEARGRELLAHSPFAQRDTKP